MRIMAAIRDIGKMLCICVVRFPVPMFFLTALALFLINAIFMPDMSWQVTWTSLYFLSACFLLTLSLTLWHEENPPLLSISRTTAPPITRIILSNTFQYLLGIIIILITAIYLYKDLGIAENRQETVLGHLSVWFALLLSVFFVSFTREKDDIPLWNFTLQMVGNVGICFLLGLVLWGGICLLLGSLEWLFGIQMTGNYYLTAGVLFGLYLPALLFLGRIPTSEQRHNDLPLTSSFLGNMMRYIFVPLEGLYLLVLLIYTIQILLRLELPDGKVSWLVIASMAGCIAIELGLYPVRKAEKRQADEGIARYLPLALAPFLLLMTVGIVRRFCDYGVTIPRLYLAALNIWFYFVCIGLYLTRARRIHWISLSLGTLFLLTSALHINFTSFTRNHLTKEVSRILAEKKAELPLEPEQYDKLMQSLSPEEASLVSSKLFYLEKTFGKEAIAQLATQEQEDINFVQYINMSGGMDEETGKVYANRLTRPVIQIPEGYTSMREFSVYEKHETTDKAAYEIPIKIEGETIDTVSLDLSLLKPLNKNMKEPLTLTGKGGRCTLAITGFYYHPAESFVDIAGYLFTK